MVLPVSWVLRPHVREWKLFVLTASYVFYGYWDWRFMGLLAGMTLVNEIAGVAIHRAVATGQRPSPAEDGAHEVVVIVVRPTSGRVVCDRRVEMLDGRPAGRELRLSCSSVLVVDAEDGGAVHVGIDGQPPVRVGPDRQPVRGRDLLAVSR